MTESSAPGGTRERVLALLLERGPSSTVLLADLLGVSTAGVRRHLDALVVDGVVSRHESLVAAPARGRGRPAQLWALTDAGHAQGPTAYDALAADALRFLADRGGPAAVRAFADQRVAELEERYREVLDDVPDGDRPAALAVAMTHDGYAATTRHGAAGVGVQLCQHHCPVREVAREFPEFCDAETAAIGRLLDVHVQRLATIAHGDGVCTTHIPLVPSSNHIPLVPSSNRVPATRDAGISTGKAPR